MKKKIKDTLGRDIKIGALIGGATAAIYSLFGPKGKENRKKAEEVVDEVKEGIAEGIKEAREGFEEYCDDCLEDEDTTKTTKEKNKKEE